MQKYKRLLIFLLIVVSTKSIVFLQPGQPKTEELNLYSQALFASILKMKGSWGHLTENSLNRMPINYDQMIVEKRSEITEKLPLKMGETQVEYLDWQALIERSKKLKKEFAILVGHPMTAEGTRLKITFSVHWITYKKRRLHYALFDWSNVYFRYDCQHEKYTLDEVRLSGI